MLRWVLLLNLLIVAPPALLTAQQSMRKDPQAVEDLKNDVLKIEEERNQALQKGDAEALDRIYTEDLVYTNARGYVLTKAQHLADIRDRKLKLTSFKHSDVEVRSHGSTGIVTGISTSLVEYNGVVSSSPRRYVNVYVKENGLWRCAVHFETAAAQQ
jgi:ketosteroid isomerase-like protein